MFKPNPPALITDPAPAGRRIVADNLFANYFAAPNVPGGGGRRPGILLIGGSEGGLPMEASRQARELARQGFNVLVVGYFNTPDTGSKLERVPLERFTRALDWLKAQSEVDASAIGIIGYSKGAEAALLVGGRTPGIRAIVAAMPSSVAWDSLALWSYVLPGGASSWSENGRDVPSLPYGGGAGGETLLPVFTSGLARLGETPEAAIPVENYTGRLMLVCGEMDNLWPSCPMARTIRDRMTGAGRPAPELLAYPAAGHGVMGIPLPETDRVMQYWGRVGGTPAANAAARADSWPRIVAFLHGTLG